VKARAPWLCPCPRPQKLSLTDKIRPVMPVLPSHAGNRKNPDYYLLFSQVLLYPKLGFKK